MEQHRPLKILKSPIVKRTQKQTKVTDRVSFVRYHIVIIWYSSSKIMHLHIVKLIKLYNQELLFKILNQNQTCVIVMGYAESKCITHKTLSIYVDELIYYIIVIFFFIIIFFSIIRSSQRGYWVLQRLVIHPQHVTLTQGPSHIPLGMLYNNIIKIKQHTIT